MEESSPLEHFTHEFIKSENPREDLLAQADVIFASASDGDGQGWLKSLVSEKAEQAELILLADSEQILRLSAYLSGIRDIWTLPMSDAELRFRFEKWQQDYKMQKDYWQTSHFLEAAIDNIPNLIWFKDKNGIHEKVNLSFCRTVNKTRKQVEGRGHAYIWDVEQDDPACIESERIVMSSRKTCVSEERIQTGEGPRLLTTYKSPLYDLDGSVMGTVGVAIDVTQERAYEQEIMQKNQTLETIFTTMDCGVMCHSTDGSRILSVNRAALRILGYESQEEMLADGFDMVAMSVVDEDKGKLRDAIRQLKKEGDSISVEYRVRHKDGEILHVMGNVKLLNENGEPLYQRFLLDCTAQKLEQKENEQHQMELVQALSIDYNLVCFFDLNTGTGRTLRIYDEENNGFARLFDGELSFDESIERYVESFVYEEDRKILREAFSRSRLRQELSAKNQHYVNYRMLLNGEMKYYQMKAVCAGSWEQSQGIVLGVRSVDEEIRREMEQKSLLEHALVQANRANKAKSVFLSNMSHDIRTPMNAIVGFTSLAINHIDQRKQVEEYLKKIMASGNHLLNLINDILDMSRIESGKVQLEEMPWRLPELLQGVCSMVQAEIHAKNLTFYMDMEELADEEIYCDKLRLNQVLLNLLSNAIKYTNEGGTIHMRILEKAGAPAGYGHYEFYVKDTGIGMSEEFVTHIFEPFEREKNSTISRIQGTGLGMAITKNIVDMMNGSIEVKSELGVGTEFRVSFHFRLHSKAEASENTGGAVSEAGAFGGAAPGGPAKGAGTRILLAEDNELNQEIAVEILKDAGFYTDVAENGQIAVDMLKSAGPGYYAAVLMDVQMPVMNGYEATRLIRGLEDERLASIPILAMTANAFEEDKQEALRHGMNGHIAKPIDSGILFETLGRVLA